MRLTDLMTNPNIPESTRQLINSLPDSGKMAIDNYCNEDSEFYKHADPRLITPKLSFDVSSNTTLYHYTTVTSLNLILESKTWLIKQKDYMNDPEEFIYTVKLATSILNELNASVDEIAAFENVLNNNPFGDSYIWSFTKNRASQTLFGNYSGDKNGVALQFDLAKIQEVLAPHFSHGKTNPNKLTSGDAYVFPLRVIYDKKIQLEYLRPVVEEWLLAYRNLNLDADDMGEIIRWCLPAITLFGLCFKNPLLRQEEEIRFVVANKREDNEMHPEVTMNETPFVKCDVEKGLIQEAILQTGNLVTVSELEALFGKHGFGDVKVSKSELPY
ncbi:DUF2971 domain-containing protein [Levilactobacillus brevis]|uniref:DUF2971 domain-containing protein n=1 Tax=Levilactobacillus brevis TaxID=1580 RepID=UPI000A2045C2|nr:DUF2971 domain-containing protein [Levilactobacillus brevis]ARN89372.1 hypothetical protein AZI09_01765 [Levilactobacillus brevis]ARN96948.1 hypothetical protein AZI10_01740 [Levilactobacillus brevis]